MFCQKCGFNAGTAKFCPKCGNMLIKPETPVTPAAQPVQETPVIPAAQPVQETPVAPVAQPAQETPVAPVAQPAQETPVAPVAQPVQETPEIPRYAPNGYSMNSDMQANNMQFGTQNMGQNYGYQATQSQPAKAKKKKKKWPMVLGIVLTIVILGGAAGFFGWKLLSKDKEKETNDTVVVSANDAIKNAGSGLETYVNNVLDSGILSAQKEKTKITGSFSLKEAKFADEDFTSVLGVDTVNYTLESITDKGEIALKLGLSKGSGKNVISCNIFSDGKNLYFNCPELFSESFKVSLSEMESIAAEETDESLQEILDIISQFDVETIDQYNDEIKAAISAIVKGINALADSCESTNVGTYAYSSENGEISVTEFSINITKDAVINAVNTTIDAVYEDSSLSTYMNLLSSFGGFTKDSLKSSVKEELQGLNPVQIKMLIDDSNNIVKVSVDLKQFDESADVVVSVEFLGGKESPFSYVVYSVDSEDITGKIVMKSANNKGEFLMEMKPKDSEYAGQYISMGIVTNVSDNTAEIEKMYLKGMFEDEFNFELSAKTTVEDITSLSMSVGSFKDAIDITDESNLTSELQNTLMEELVENKEVLKGLVSDDIYELYIAPLFEVEDTLPDVQAITVPVL